MCGIVGFVGDRDATPVLVDGLRRLEYRGYDSAGLAVAGDHRVDLRRTLGKLSELESSLAEAPLSGHAGIGHTRWATHGRPSVENAHPHRAGDVYVVHNGIIENHAELRGELEGRGHKFASQTDTEVVAHLIDELRGEGSELGTAVRRACARLRGSYAIAVLCGRQPDTIVATRNGGSPLIVATESSGTYLASDIPALLPYTRQIVALEDGELAILTRRGLEIRDARDHAVKRPPREIQWDPVAAEKDGYDRFMQKEIFEQPRAIAHTLAGRIREDGRGIDLDGIALRGDVLARLRRIYLVGCGTAYYASMLGKAWIERLCRIPAEAVRASEFRYGSPVLDESCWVVPVSQSGETADTLAALRLAREHGAHVLSICNVRDSSIPRESDDVLYTQAGPEIGVASTKAFTTQLVALYLLALELARGLGRSTAGSLDAALAELGRLGSAVQTVLEREDDIEAIARRYRDARSALFVGRGLLYPIALEGALKLKEISYIHAEGYAGGELKHGPIALVDAHMPSVVLALRNATYDKIVSNLEQIRSREGIVIAVATEGDAAIAEKASDVIYVPEVGEMLAPIVATIPLQLLAYHVAVLKGNDVDQPRNLAKSVTVE